MGFKAGVATGAVAVLAGMALMAAAGPSRFKTIDVERINVREADGTLRFVLASKSAFPGAFVKGREIARPDRRSFAGMLFMNEEGTENGGLIWRGSRDAQGRVDAGASLTFDRYENDQTLQLLQTDRGIAGDTSALIFSDRPAIPLDDAKIAAGRAETDPAKRAAMLAAGGVGGAPRIFVGRTRDRNSMVMLQDGKGVPRLMLRVGMDGAASIDFLDERGKTLRSIGPTG